MTKKLVWRLGKLPSPDEVRELVKDKIITQEEAREILFSSETEEERDKKSLESEIKFLRELVEKLSRNRTQIVETIREVESPWRRYPWYEPYIVWCSNGGDTETTLVNADASNTLSIYDTTSTSFSNIKTF